MPKNTCLFVKQNQSVDFLDFSTKFSHHLGIFVEVKVHPHEARWILTLKLNNKTTMATDFVSNSLEWVLDKTNSYMLQFFAH